MKRNPKINYIDLLLSSRDKDTFKLRSNVEKRVFVSLVQISDSLKLKVMKLELLCVRRCRWSVLRFGNILAPIWIRIYILMPIRIIVQN
jgi:hypothetical protein